MTDTSEPQGENKIDEEIKTVQLASAQLELRIKQADLEYKPSHLMAAIASPVVMAALIAGLATAVGAMLTHLTSEAQLSLEREKAANAQKLERLKYDSSLLLDAARTGDPDRAAENIAFLVDAGLLSDHNLESRLSAYLLNRVPHHGKALPPAPAPTSTPARRN